VGLALLAWLVVGGALTVAQAWTTALLPDLTFAEFLPGPRELRIALDPWPYATPAGFRPIRSGNRARRLLADLDLHADASREPEQYVLAYRYGWPVRSLALWKARTYPIHARTKILSEETGGKIPLTIFGARAPDLPALVLWPGFALNTLIYAALAWSVWRLPFAVRRYRRRRRGRCVKCGYDRTGLAPAAPCPECGTTP
jgi:hypothetical protein